MGSKSHDPKVSRPETTQGVRYKISGETQKKALVCLVGTNFGTKVCAHSPVDVTHQRTHVILIEVSSIREGHATESVSKIFRATS